METFKFAGRKDGVIKLFDTEREASEYADNDSTIAKYTTENGTNFDLVEIVGIKTSTDNIGKILEQS